MKFSYNSIILNEKKENIISSINKFTDKNDINKNISISKLLIIVKFKVLKKTKI